MSGFYGLIEGTRSELNAESVTEGLRFNSLGTSCLLDLQSMFIRPSEEVYIRISSGQTCVSCKDVRRDKGVEMTNMGCCYVRQ